MATSKKTIAQDISTLKAGELYKISLPKTSVPMYVGVTADGKNVLMGAYITVQNLHYKNVSSDRIYKSKAAVIAQLKSWAVL